MLYDDVLDVTWLQDANYAKTSNYDLDGRMDFTAANTWAAAFSSILNGTNIANLAMVANLQSDVYWSGVPYAPVPHHQCLGVQYRQRRPERLQSGQ